MRTGWGCLNINYRNGSTRRYLKDQGFIFYIRMESIPFSTKLRKSLTHDLTEPHLNFLPGPMKRICESRIIYL